MLARPARLVVIAVALVVTGCAGGTAPPEDGEVPAASESPPRDTPPLLRADVLASGQGPGMTHRSPDEDEEEGGLPTDEVRAPLDTLVYGEVVAEIVGPPAALTTSGPAVHAVVAADTDRDCLPDSQESALGTDPRNPDTDGDGWFDGPCNERRKLVLEAIKAYDEQEDAGEDEL